MYRGTAEELGTAEAEVLKCALKLPDLLLMMYDFRVSVPTSGVH